MTPFVYCNEFVFRTTFIALLVAAFVGTVCFAISLSYKLKLRFVLPELFFAVCSALMICLLSDGISIRDFSQNPNDFPRSACFLPTWCVALVSSLLLAFVCVCLIAVIKKRLGGLTAMSVKEALYVLPVGVCFYDETGRLLLTNRQIADECKEITGLPLWDGAAFWQALCHENTVSGVTCSCEGSSVLVEKSDGRATCYKKIEHVLEGKTVYELSASDISREFALKKKAEEQNEELRKMNLRLRKYGETVTEVTKERETLAARVRVHDGMGSLILKTKRALLQKENTQSLIAEWQGILSFIFAPETETSREDVQKTAESVGVKIFYQGALPEKGSVAEKILVNALSECITNTARHADGDKLFVTAQDDGKFFTARFCNNGKQPQTEIVEGGGLSSLRRMTEMQCGSMKTESFPQFVLTVTIPKGEQ